MPKLRQIMLAFGLFTSNLFTGLGNMFLGIGGIIKETWKVIKEAVLIISFVCLAYLAGMVGSFVIYHDQDCDKDPSIKFTNRNLAYLGGGMLSFSMLCDRSDKFSQPSSGEEVIKAE